MSLNDFETRKFRAVVSHVNRGSRGSTLDSLHLTDERKWGRRSLGNVFVRWPHHFKAGNLVEFEWKITKLNSKLLDRMFPYDSLWNLLTIVLLLLAVSMVAGFVALALSHINLIGLSVLIAVFIGLWRPFINHLERQGTWGIWETPARDSFE